MLDTGQAGPQDDSASRPSRSSGGSKKWRSPAIWWPFAIGFIFLSLAIWLEHGIATQRADGAGTAHETVVFRFDSLILLISELGYAFIIAWVVSYFIEASAKREQSEAFDRSMADISKEVFSGVFGIRHSPQYVRAVVANCLETRLVREGYDISYTVDAFSPEQEAAYELDPGRFVQVMGVMRYFARNVGTKTETFTTSYGIPTRSGKLRALSGLTGLKVGTKTYTEAERAKLRVVQETDDHPTDEMYRFEFELDPLQSVEVIIEALLVKERSDSDTFGFGLPTMDANVRLNMNIPGMRFGATPRIVGGWRELRSPNNGRSGEWKVEHPILPYNSVILWWRSAADDGAPVSPEDAGRVAPQAPPEPPEPPEVEKADTPSDENQTGKGGIHGLERVRQLFLRGKKRSDKS